MAGFNPNRVLKGVRTGGQFDHARRAESTLTLASPATISEPAQTSHEDLANAAHEHLLSSLREARTYPSGGLSVRNFCPPRAFKDVPRPLNTDTH